MSPAETYTATVGSQQIELPVIPINDDLAIALLITVDKGTSLKRSSARAKGRGNQIEKQTCHIAITVADTPAARH